MQKLSVIFCFLWVVVFANAQQSTINFTPDGNSYTQFTDGAIIATDIKTNSQKVLVTKAQLTFNGKPLNVEGFQVSKDGTKFLIFANAARVWRYKTKGDYFIVNTGNNSIKQIGKERSPQSLQFAKFSPMADKVAYVSESNIYVEEVNSPSFKKLTLDGTRKFINGTFDWAYEEEFGLRDGFRWSPDGTRIAFWQIDATKIKDYNMLNTTDANYSKVIPVEYPKVGEAPSPAKIGVVNVTNGQTKFLSIEGNPQQHYITKLDWASNTEIFVQQLNRKQQESKLLVCNANDASTKVFWAESDDAWVDMHSTDPAGNAEGFKFVNNGADFIWISEKNGWRQIYKISKDGKSETLLTKGNFDVAQIKCIDEKNNMIYFTASPVNPTQRYLYAVKLNPNNTDKNEPELITNDKLQGTHGYTISSNGRWAKHSFSNHKTPPVTEWVALPEHKSISGATAIAKTITTSTDADVEYLQINTKDNVTLDVWINKPKNFNPNKKYPVVMYVYGEPAAETVADEFGNHTSFLYAGDMRQDGYVQVSIDNRGTPMLKGAKWRKAIYRNIGMLNIRDQAMGMEQLLATKSYLDKDRVAVWGWSGGGSSTLNLMFQYPKIFKTGIAIAAVGNQLFYDNIYQERYMGLPQENKQDFINGSPITHASKLEGKLLYIHGTGDDNVHYSNAEVLINQLVKHNKQFQFMAYPNRSHSLAEGEGTWEHLTTLYTNFLRANCPAGAR
jgi:dipeptidyl-peptidase 4